VFKVSHVIEWCVNCPWKDGNPTKQLCTSSDCQPAEYCHPIGFGKVETAHPLFQEFNIELCRKCGEKLIKRILEDDANV
jgi:hypothetical protein